MNCAEHNDNYPKIILWAWERKEDLRFLKNENISVAYLALTIRISANVYSVRRRNNVLIIPDKNYRFPVVRIEAANSSLPLLNEATEILIVNEINQIIRDSKTNKIQIDFDALKSQREFYRKILIRLRNTNTKDLFISITALLSWCIYDDWISKLSVDEIVPMIFDLGYEKKEILSYLKKNPNLIYYFCRDNIGVSEISNINLKRKKNIYLFNSNAWTEESLNKFLKQIDLYQGIKKNDD